MDLFQLTYFIEVAHKKSFTKASHSLHISQPSISKGIKALETYWQVQLFNRTGKHVELTETGAYLLPKIEAIIDELSQINEELESPQYFNSGIISVGIPPMIGSTFISPFIHRFVTTYPEIKLELTEVGSQEIISSIDNGTIQAGFVALPINTDTPYDFFIFDQEFLHVVLWPGHPLSDKSELTLENIKDEALIYYPESFSLHSYIRSFYQKISARPIIIGQTSNWDFMGEMVRTKLGIALLPQSICDRFNSTQLKTIPLVEPKIPWTLAMVWKSRGFLSHSTRMWVNSFKEYYKNPRIK